MLQRSCGKAAGGAYNFRTSLFGTSMMMESVRCCVRRLFFHPHNNNNVLFCCQGNRTQQVVHVIRMYTHHVFPAHLTTPLLPWTSASARFPPPLHLLDEILRFHRWRRPNTLPHIPPLFVLIVHHHHRNLRPSYLLPTRLFPPFFFPDACMYVHIHPLLYVPDNRDDNGQRHRSVVRQG